MKAGVVYVVENRVAPGEWEPRGTYLDEFDATVEMVEIAESEGGKWRICEYAFVSVRNTSRDFQPRRTKAKKGGGA